MISVVSVPMAREEIKDKGILLCEYHGKLVSKIRLLKLWQMEQAARTLDCRPVVNNIMRIVCVRPNDKIYQSERIRQARLTAMTCSDEYFKRNYMKILGAV